MSEDLLDNFLLAAADEYEKKSTPQRQLKETDLFSQENCSSQNNSNKLPSTVHTGDTDSSDDEDNKYYEERKYNDCGRDIKHLLESTATTSGHSLPERAVTWKSQPRNEGLDHKKQVPSKPQDVNFDPIFGLRIVNPLVSFTTLQERMVGRESVMFSTIRKFVAGNTNDKNWVIGGVIVGKSAVKTSQKGSQFLIWTLSDLKNDIKTVSIFLFANAYKQLWKTPTGTVVGILNPTVLEKKEGSKDEALLSVDNAQKVMILGQSKDLGKCKSTKKNGEQCNAVVNISRCEYCIYHIKQEYQKCSKRSELQSNFSGKGLTALRNKVLGKNEVFYAGKLYTAIPAKRSKKLEDRNESLLDTLRGKNPVNKSKKKPRKPSKSAANIEVTHRQRLRDLSLLEKLGGSEARTTFNASHSSEVTLESSKKNAIEVIAKLKENRKNDKISAEPDLPKDETILKKKSTLPQTNLAVMDFPLLSSGKTGVIDLDGKITPKQVNRAKLNALKFVQRNGPLKKSDPNCVKKSAEHRKRVMENIENEGNPSKRQKIVENEFLSDRFKKMMEATSKHVDLLNDRDDEEQEKYFHKLEMKERMEEQMINTYKVPCKAVRCSECKYTNFSASQFCKDNKHRLRVFDAVKRFFKCGHCGNRTQSLEVVPTTSCKNCGSGKWERTGMMKEKKVEVSAHKLSIRGGEQTFINSVASDANLDLLVPDE